MTSSSARMDQSSQGRFTPARVVTLLGVGICFGLLARVPAVSVFLAMNEYSAFVAGLIVAWAGLRLADLYQERMRLQ